MPREFLQYSKVQDQFTLLKDSRLLCTYTTYTTYTNYYLPFGVVAVVCYDYGKIGTSSNPLQLALSNGHAARWLGYDKATG